MAANNPFPASANIRLDSPPCRLSAANSTKLSAVNGSILGLDLKVPDVAFNIDNAFGTPIAYVQWTNVTIVQAVFQTTNTKQQGGVAGNVIYRMYKGPTSQSKGVVYFRNVSLAGVNLKYGFTGGFSIVYSVLLGSSSAATSGASSLGSISISYQIQGCEVPYYTQVESGMLLSDGSMSYACLPIINIDNLTNLIAGGLSSVLLLMTLLMGISAIRRSRQSSEETDIKRTAFSNHLIALGCLLHIATGVTYFVQSGASCIAAQWLDLTSFTLLLLIIIFKTSQVKTIFLGSARLGGFERPISNTEIGVFIVIYEVLVILFLISWTIFGPIEMLDKQVVWLPGYVQNQVCSTNGLTSMFQIVEIIWKFGLLSISLRQSYHTRYIQSVYAESFPLAWVTYIWAVCYLILYPIDLADSIYPITRLTVQLVRILLPSSLTTIILLSNIENVRSVLSRMSGTAMDSNFDSFNRIYAYFRTSDPLATAEAKHLGARFFPTTASDRLEINSLRKNVGTPSSGLLSGATETSKSFSSFTDEGGSNAFLSLKNPHQSSVNYR